MASRIVVVDKIYHQPPNESPVGESLGFSRAVASDEVPYSRPVKVGPEAVPVDKGWVEEVGMILVKTPSDAKSDLSVLLNAFELVVKPGEHLRLPVSIIEGIRLSASAEVQATVTVYPR